jgi:hypothetical protein
MPRSSTLQQRFHGWLSDHPDDEILRWIFRSAVAATVAVLAVDLGTNNGWITQPDPALTPAETRPASPALDLPVPSILAPLLPGAATSA